jgi:uncharacterized RDD family membrane protein YckC
LFGFAPHRLNKTFLMSPLYFTAQWLLGYLVCYPSGVVFIWVGLNRRKQCWHDKIARTVVISDKGKEPVRFGD